jgi:hypothetical protein
MKSRLGALILVLALGFQAGWSGSAPATAVFLEGVEDLPLMPGLSQLDNAGVAFDAAAGRIVVLWAVGSVTQAAVVEFYDATLPELGWAATGQHRFRREDEDLQLDFFGDGRLSVRFTLSPARD